MSDDDVTRLAAALATQRFGELFRAGVEAAFTDRLVAREEAARIFAVSPREFDQNERPFLPWVPIGKPAGKRTAKRWRLSDLYARIEQKKQRAGT